MSSRVTVLARGTARVNVPTPAPDLVSQATGAWRAATVESDGRSLTDLTGAGRHMLAGGVAGSTPTTNDPTVLDFTGVRYMFLDGVAGNYASVPDEAALDVVGDIDITVDVALDDWTPASISALASKVVTSSPQRSYLLRIATTGEVSLLWSEDGSALKSQTSTIATGLAGGTRHAIRATLDIDNGAGGHDVKFYVDGVQLGATVTTAGTTSIFAGTAAVEVGAYGGGSVNPAAGRFYGAVVKDGIDGTTVLDVDFTRTDLAAAPYTTVTAVTGQTVTLAGRATLVTSPRLYLDGTDDFLSVADDVVFDVGAGDDLTVVSVFRAYGSNGFGRLIQKGTGSNPRWLQLAENIAVPNNYYSVVHDGTDQAITNTADVVPSSVGEFVVFGTTLDRAADRIRNFDGATAKALVDSSSVDSLENTGDVFVGADNGTVNFLDVEWFGVAIFKGRVLTAAEIAQVGRELAVGETSVA